MESTTNPTGSIIGQVSYGGLGIYWRTNNALYDMTTHTKYPLETIYCGAYTRGGETIKETSRYTLPFDQWIHLTLVANYSQKTLSFYVNGDKIGGAISYATLPIITGDRNFGIGKAEVYGGNDPGANLPMLINDVRIYDHALSMAEIQELKKALVVHYTFDDILIEKNMLHNETGFIQATISDHLTLARDAVDQSLSLQCSGSTRISLPINGDGAKATLSFWLYRN